MKRRLTWTLALFLALACNRENTQNAANDTATTATNATDTVSTVSPADTGTTSTSSTGATGGSASTLTDDEKAFVIRTAMGGMTEVQAGTVGAQKGVRADVKTFASRMVNDHGKANDELKVLATNKGIALPVALDGEHQQALDALSAKNGTDFDQAFITRMIADHQKTVSDFEAMSKSAKDPDLKTWATNTLPTLQEHLMMAKSLVR